jgi:hypothetical protein
VCYHAAMTQQYVFDSVFFISMIILKRMVIFSEEECCSMKSKILLSEQIPCVAFQLTIMYRDLTIYFLSDLFNGRSQFT